MMIKPYKPFKTQAAALQWCRNHDVRPQYRPSFFKKEAWAWYCGTWMGMSAPSVLQLINKMRKWQWRNQDCSNAHGPPFSLIPLHMRKSA